MDVLVFSRTYANDTLHVLVNFSQQPQGYSAGAGRRVLLTTDSVQAGADTFDGVLGPLTACVLF